MKWWIHQFLEIQEQLPTEELSNFSGAHILKVCIYNVLNMLGIFLYFYCKFIKWQITMLFVFKAFRFSSKWRHLFIFVLYWLIVYILRSINVPNYLSEVPVFYGVVCFKNFTYSPISILIQNVDKISFLTEMPPVLV